MKMSITTGALLFLVAGCATPSKSELDTEVNRLCALDGGVKVYETVKLPQEKFDQSGRINFFNPALGENALGPEYLYTSTIHYYKHGEGQQLTMWRSEQQIIRRSDGKILGVSVRYTRRGGDAPGPWHPSSFSCPSVTGGQPTLQSSVFVKGQAR